MVVRIMRSLHEFLDAGCSAAVVVEVVPLEIAEHGRDSIIRP
jgi:hypothetical protein